MAEWLVRWTIYEAGDPGLSPGSGGRKDYRLIISVLGGNLTWYCYQQYRPRLDNQGGNVTHRGLFWK